MGLSHTLVDVFKRLVGIAKEPAVVTLDAGASAAAVEEVEEAEEAEEAEHDDEASTVEDDWADTQAFIARCEAEALDVAGLQLGDPDAYWARHQRIEAAGGQGSRDERARAAGFKDARHWDSVSHYVRARWSELVRGEQGASIREKAEFRAAAERAGRR